MATTHNVSYKTDSITYEFETEALASSTESSNKNKSPIAQRQVSSYRYRRRLIELK